MILKALAEHRAEDKAGRSVPAGYAKKANLGFQLVLQADGRCRLDEHYHLSEPPRPRVVAAEDLVPDLTRSNNPPPILGCDNASFVLGRPKGGSEEEQETQKAASKHLAFVGLMKEYLEVSADPSADAYLRWVADGRPGLEAAVGQLSPHAMKRLDLDLIEIRSETADRPLHQESTAVAFWGGRVAATKAGGRSSTCLSCGKFGPVVDTLPQALSGRYIPGTQTAQVALMSVNFPSAARGASGSGLKSAPVCLACASAAVAGFNHLASTREHRINLGEGSAAIWWATHERASGWMRALTHTDPKVVRDLMNAPFTGVVAAPVLGRFYLLTFSGNVARLVVRRWLDLSLGGTEESVRSWFRDTEVPDPKRPFPPLTTLAASLGPFPTGDQPVYPEGSFEALLLTALTGERPPGQLLRPAIARSVAEVRRLREDGLEGWSARQRAMARLALIRLVLNRMPHRKGPHMTSHLDESRKDPAYVNGRLFAVRERLQYVALGEVNASIVDRYFARAVQHPASVDGALSSLEKAHLRTVARKRGIGARIALDQQISALHAVGDAPGRLSIEEQAAWVAGYYQQREHDFASAQGAAKTKTQGANVPTEGDDSND